MKILGLILECNPYHYGHEYFIKEAIKLTNPDYVIAVISGSFTMRGDVSILNKFDKTRILLSKGVDLVIELPIIETLNSADYYAQNVCNILIAMNVTDIAFGTENLSLKDLESYFNIINSPEYQEIFKKYNKTRISYKKAHQKALEELFGKNCDNLILPNNTLAMQYFKTIYNYNLKTKNEICLHTINRKGTSDNEKDINRQTLFQSATALRSSFQNGNSISEYIPYNENILMKINYDKLWNLFLYNFYQENIKGYLKSSSLSKEGVENYIANRINPTLDYQTSLQELKNSRYSLSMFKRIILKSLLLQTNKNYHIIEYGYVRLLGFTKKGEKLISELNKPINFITSLKKSYDNEIINDYIADEKLATRLYEILTKRELYNQEFKIPIKEKN